MIEGLEQELTLWFGSATALGASSWLEAFTWIAALCIAGFAGIALRRQSFQSRATLLLSIYERWESISDSRKTFFAMYKGCRKSVLAKHADMQHEHQIDPIRDECRQKLESLRANDDPKFADFVKYVTFFELLGAHVRNGYLPVRDIIQMYKGPILDLDVATRSFIGEWQKEAHTPPGLLENALYLMRRVRIREDRPIYYRTWYQVRRIFIRLP